MEAAYCRSRNLLRKVDRPAMTEEKQHCARTSSRKNGFSSRLTSILGNTDSMTGRHTSEALEEKSRREQNN